MLDKNRADRSAPRVVDEVSEADLAERSIPAYSDDPEADTDIEQEIGVAVDRDAL
ncbi:hypothetical protein [Nocardia sp. NPDC049707]|uniref:hypothetical protein n=1 Tax=Nocardia sp. NPDC049707 TaxID=3154735 RepID=UPI00342E33C6